MALLIVEDEEAVRSMMAEHLRDVGYEVLEAVNALEAREILAHPPSPVHLVVTDFRMPGENGVQLARHIHERYPAIPVLVASGNVTPKEIDGERFLMKPFTLDRLASEVRAILHPV